AQIDDIERVEAEISQLVMNTVDELPAGKSRNPRLVWTVTSANLGDYHGTIGIWMERVLDNLIGQMRTVVVAGIYKSHAGLYRPSQNSDDGSNVPRRSPHFRASKLHCPVAHAVHSHRCAR